MSLAALLKKLHLVTVPQEFGELSGVTIRFCQLNAKKMAKADEANTLQLIQTQNRIMSGLSEEARTIALNREVSPEVAQRGREKAEAPNTVDDYDAYTLIALAHCEVLEGETWTAIADDQIDDLVCLEWLAGQIYDVSKPASAEAREKN